MASAARAYYEPQIQPRRDDQFRVVPGGRSDATLSRQAIFLAKAFMVALVVFAAVAFVRIGLASATVTTAMETEHINAQVDSIRSGSVHLEVTESALANPAAVKSAATQSLGMVTPTETVVITLPVDVVAYDEAGNLSLSRSLARPTLG